MPLAAAEYVYSIYTDDDDVCLYDNLVDARRAKRRLARFVEVRGPFSHPRHELPLVRAAATAVRDLRRLLSTTARDQDIEIERIASDLAVAARDVFPFRRVPLIGGDSIDLHSNLLNDSRQ